MSVQQLNYYRITCDDDGCPAYLNVAAPDVFGLQPVLDGLKNRDGTRWVVQMVTQGPPEVIRSWCPQHMEETHA